MTDEYVPIGRENLVYVLNNLIRHLRAGNIETVDAVLVGTVKELEIDMAYDELIERQEATPDDKLHVYFQ